MFFRELEIIMPCIKDITVMAAYDVQGDVVEDCPVGQEEDDYLLEMSGIGSEEVSATEMRDMADALETVEIMRDFV
jgi:hypothetical protein